MTNESDRLLGERLAVRDAAAAMAQGGLATGSSGNVSVRWEDGILITASGIPYDRLRPEQIVEIDSNGQRRSGEGEPSSEWRMHAAIYAMRPDVVAIVHSHSVHATAAAIALTALPIPHDEGRIVYGNEVPISEHQPPGTTELADAVASALGAGKLVLIARHGAVAVGSSLDEALGAAVKLEEIAQLALLAGQFRAIGPDPKEVS
jgi:L-fuculose-phosphate aldolase